MQKVAIVTGASRGIGAAIAQRLAKDGFAVIVNYANNDALAHQVVQLIQEQGGLATALKANISCADEVKILFQTVLEQYGRIDVLVNNAGIMNLASIQDTTNEMLDTQINTNFKGTFYTLREAANFLSEGGRIVNFSTSVVGLKLENYAVYAATKAAVETLTAIMAKEMRGRNITVNTIAPGPTATDLFLNGKTEELVEKMSKNSPLERLGTPEEIASTVAFLVGTDGAWVNGQTLRANGGIV